MIFLTNEDLPLPDSAKKNMLYVNKYIKKMNCFSYLLGKQVDSKEQSHLNFCVA